MLFEIAAGLFGKIVVVVFLFVLVVLGIAGSLAFEERDAAFKRKWFPRCATLVGVLVVAAILVFEPEPVMVVAMALMMAISVSRVLIITQFCDGCGATIAEGEVRFCPKCGAKLMPPKPDPIDEL